MEFVLHHIGIVVKDIERAAEDYIQRLGWEIATNIIHDPVQNAYIQFLRHRGDSTYLELVSPDGPGSKLTNALSKGGGLNHLCFAVPEIESACRHLRDRGMILLQRPVPAMAFAGRRIAWLMGQDQVPIELLEKGHQGEL